MKRKSTLFLLLTTLLLIAFLVPACQKKYELDNQALLQLQCNASDAESIIDEIGETDETTAESTEERVSWPSETSETEETHITETSISATVETTKQTTKETTKETTEKPTETTADPSTRVAPVVTAFAGTNSVTVSWNKITNPDLVGYKVVASVSDSTPMYSENGYYEWITDLSRTSCTIAVGDGYNGGDVGCFSGGTAYYFSVTAVYGDEWQKVAGNAVYLTMPGTACTPTPALDPSTFVAPVVTAVAGDQSVIVSWNKITNPDLVGYKVVASISNSTPMYPANGHYEFITDANITSCTIKNGIFYNGEEFRNFSGGVSYYFSVTAVYNEDNWQYVAGNAVQVRMPAQEDTVGTYPASTLDAPIVSADSVLFEWSKTTDIVGFKYYKVVVSQTDTTPTYTDNGYLVAIDNPDVTEITKLIADGLSSGKWYVGITTVYEENGRGQYIYSNFQTFTIP